MCKRVAHKYPPQKSLEREKVVSTSARWKTQHSNRTGHNLQSKRAKKNNLKKGKSLKAGKVISIDVCYTRSTTPDLGLWLLLNLAIGPPHTHAISSQDIFSVLFIPSLVWCSYHIHRRFCKSRNTPSVFLYIEFTNFSN